jgi:hypothetical protein
MDSYKKAYFLLFNRISDLIEDLKAARYAAEQTVLSEYGSLERAREAGDVSGSRGGGCRKPPAGTRRGADRVFYALCLR